MAKALDDIKHDFVALLTKGYSVDKILRKKMLPLSAGRTTLFRWQREYRENRLGSDVVKR